MIYRLAALCVAGCLLGASAQAQAPGQWRVYMSLQGGPATFCQDVAHLWVRESDGKFRLFDARNKFEGWSLPMAPDGSIKAVEVRDGLRGNKQVRVTIPAGTGPRSFDVLELGYACRYHFEPR
ncbi:MAG: hypothetical protein NTV97_06915 [Alphaproteobacteria bacterium]|nr:hypothetical protein [Alphaproteobacteria bacterium]